MSESSTNETMLRHNVCTHRKIIDHKNLRIKSLGLHEILAFKNITHVIRKIYPEQHRGVTHIVAQDALVIDSITFPLIDITRYAGTGFAATEGAAASGP